MSWLLADAITYRFSGGAILLLVAPVIIWLYWRLAKHREAVVRAFLGEHLGHNLSVMRGAINATWRTIFLALSWMLAAISLMQPVWESTGRSAVTMLPSATGALSSQQAHSGPIQRKPHDVIFLLDVSASMTVADTATGQTRFEFARDVINDTIMRLSADNIGLYIFTSTLKDAVPPTLDHLYLRMELQKVTINGTGTSGTDFRKVLGDLSQELWSQPSDKFTTLIILSDGGDTTLEGLPVEDRAGYIRVILHQLSDINRDRRRIFTVGVGSVQGQDIPSLDYQGHAVHSGLMVDLLQDISSANNGAFLQASDFEGPGLSEELSTLTSEGGPSSLEATSSQSAAALTTASSPPMNLHEVPLVLAIALLMLALALPEAEQKEMA